MIPEANDINWHDMSLLKVEEIVDDDVLRWHVNVDVSDAFDGSKYNKCIIEFHGAHKYSVDEGRVASPTIILDMEMSTVDQGYGLGSITSMKFGTTAGYRIVFCGSIRIVPYA